MIAVSLQLLSYHIASLARMSSSHNKQSYFIALQNFWHLLFFHYLYPYPTKKQILLSAVQAKNRICRIAIHGFLLFYLSFPL